jgi:hypothetical protein
MQNQTGNEELCRQALSNLKLGLELLDQAGAPGDIGAHVDLAICRLEESLVSSDEDEMEPLRVANGS